MSRTTIPFADQEEPSLFISKTSPPEVLGRRAVWAMWLATLAMTSGILAGIHTQWSNSDPIRRKG